MLRDKGLSSLTSNHINECSFLDDDRGPHSILQRTDVNHCLSVIYSNRLLCLLCLFDVFTRVARRYSISSCISVCDHDYDHRHLCRCLQLRIDYTRKNGP